jgi:hypothetical protein
MKGHPRFALKIALGTLGLLVWGTGWADAGGWLRRRTATTTAPAPAPAPGPVPTSYSPSPYPMLGTFYPSPYLMVRGNFPAGGGYSPLGSYGDTSLVINGPLSAFRAYTAPVVSYTRGYDGRPAVVEGYSFSTPNRPEVTPVVYPTQANYYYRIRTPGEPPWWANGSNWIDQN